jgi:hypothetical protein
MTLPSNHYSLAILITSYKSDFYKFNLRFLTHFVPQVVVIGDEEVDISKQSGQGFVADTLDSAKQIGLLPSTGNILVYIETHGILLTTGQHALNITPKSSIITSSLFHVLHDKVGQKIDIIFAPCHGKAAMPDIDKLPFGSRVLFFSDSDGSTLYSNLYATQYALLEKDLPLTLEEYFAQYLVHLGQPESPVIASVGAPLIDPLRQCLSYLGKVISPSEHDYVLHSFAKKICGMAVTCYERIEYVMGAMESVQQIKMFSHVARHSVSVAHKKANATIESYAAAYMQSHPDAAMSPLSLYAVKVEADKIFAEYQLPFEFTLERIAGQFGAPEFEAIDDKYVRDLYYFIETSSVAGIAQYFHSLPDEYIVNDHFPLPNYNYGLVLGISQALADYVGEAEQ